MRDQLAPDLDQALADRLDGLALPGLRHRQQAMGEEEIVRHDPNREVHRIGRKVAAGQPVHPEAAFELLDVALDVGPSIVEPDDLFCGRLDDVGRDAVVGVGSGEQIPLGMPPPDDDQPEGRVPLVLWTVSATSRSVRIPSRVRRGVQAAAEIA